MIHIEYLPHHEIVWRFEDASYEDIQYLCNIFFDTQIWSRDIKKRDRMSLPLISDVKNRDIIARCIDKIKKREDILLPSSYHRKICYLVAILLHTQMKKIIHTEYEQVGCRNRILGRYDECNCRYINRKWKNIRGEPDYDDYEMIYYLPIAKVIGLKCV